MHWQLTAQGQPMAVSYSVVAQDMAFAGARNCRKMTPLDGLMSASRIAPETARAEIAAAFAMWEAVASISFREAESPERAEILIGAQLEPEGWAFADVFYDASSREPVKPISRSLICLNPSAAMEGRLRRRPAALRHPLHARPRDRPRHRPRPSDGRRPDHGLPLRGGFRELQAGDIAGVVQLYGKRRTRGDGGRGSATGRRHVRRMSPARLYARRWGSRAFTAPAH